MIWPAMAAIGGGRLLTGFGEMGANAELKGQKKQLGFLASQLDETAAPIGAELQRGYAPGGWYRNVVSANQAADAEIARARAEPGRLAAARGAGGIRSGAFANRRGGWLNTLASAGLAGDLAGLHGGTGLDLTQRLRTIQRFAPVQPQNRLEFAGNALRGAGEAYLQAGGGGGGGVAPIRYGADGTGYWGSGAESYTGW